MTITGTSFHDRVDMEFLYHHLKILANMEFLYNYDTKRFMGKNYKVVLLQNASLFYPSFVGLPSQCHIYKIEMTLEITLLAIKPVRNAMCNLQNLFWSDIRLKKLNGLVQVHLPEKISK